MMLASTLLKVTAVMTAALVGTRLARRSGAATG
jgi:hypothetical protein